MDKQKMATENAGRWAAAADRIVRVNWGMPDLDAAVTLCTSWQLPDAIIAELDRDLESKRHNMGSPDTRFYMATLVLCAHRRMAELPRYSAQWWGEQAYLAYCASIMQRAELLLATRMTHATGKATESMERSASVKEALKQHRAQIGLDARDDEIRAFAAEEKVKKKHGYLKRTGTKFNITAGAVTKILARKTRERPHVIP